MEATEVRLGRIFHLKYAAGDDFYGEFNQFVKEKKYGPGRFFSSELLQKLI